MKINLKNLKEKKHIEVFLKLYNEKHLELTDYLRRDKAIIRFAENQDYDGNTYPGELSKEILINLLFLYFLSDQDGIVKLNMEEDFSKCIKTNSNFYKNFLIDLFHDFNTNSGIELLGLDRELFSGTIPNYFFTNEFKNGILDILSSFKYSLDESSEPEDSTLNPRILEMVFENLYELEDKKSKGVYYTPGEIVRYISRESIVYYLSNKFSIPYKEVKDFVYYKSLDEKSDLYDMALQIDKSLENMRVGDLAVGGGAFPLAILHIVLELRENLSKLLASKYKNGRCRYKLKLNTIKKTIYAMDIDANAVRITNFRLYLSLLSEGKVIKDFTSNIYTANGLLDEFPEKNIYFDIVAGNPPYVGEKGNKDIFREIAQTEFGKKYYQGKMDLYYFFFHRAMDISRDGAIIALITTNYYITANGAYNLRTDIKNRSKVLKLINFNEVKLFGEADGQHNLISFIKRDSSIKDIECEIINVNKTNHISRYKSYHYKLFQGDQQYIRIIEGGDRRLASILEKISEGISLGEICNVNQGIVSGADSLTERHIRNFKIEGQRGEGIFVLNKEEIGKKNFDLYELDVLKPFFKNSDIKKYSTTNISDKKIIYINRKIQEIKKEYPNIKRHLDKYYKILSKRRETQKGYLKYFHLNWARNEEIFKREKIVAPQRNLENTFAYNNTPWYASADVYFITPNVKDINLKYILAILNSKLYYLWFYHMGKRKGDMLELYQTPLRETPIILNNESEKELICLVDKILEEEQDYNIKTIQSRIDDIVFNIFKLTKEEINYINNSR